MSRISNLPGTQGVDVSVSETTTPPPVADTPKAEKSQTPASGQTVERYASSSPDASVTWANPYDHTGPSLAASALAFGSAAAWKAFDDVTFGSSTNSAAPGTGKNERANKGQKAEKKQKPQWTEAEKKENRALQRNLNVAMKAGLKVDGDAGEKTQAALKKFQKDNQLPETGVFDAKTREALASATQKAREESIKGLTEKMNKHEAKLPGMWQNNALWGQESVNDSNKSLGAVGCAITDLAMLVSAKLGRVVTPDELNEKLREGGVFKKKEDPNLTFESVGPALLAAYGEAVGELQNVKRSSPLVNMSGEEIKKTVDSELKAGRMVMLHVDYENEPSKADTDNVNGDHWVIIYKGDNGKYRAVDPAYGEDFTYTFSEDTGFVSNDKKYDNRDKVHENGNKTKREKYDADMKAYEANGRKGKAPELHLTPTGHRTAVGVVTFSPTPSAQTAQKQ
jgi:Putative peptidoglycan binding domain